MFKDIGVFQAASANARHASTRQGVIAQNVANSNTPGFKARDLTDFEAVSRNAKPPQMFVTRAGHFAQDTRREPPILVEDKQAIPSPDGNSVSIENEILKSVDAERQHSRAMAVYQSSLNLLRTSIGRGR